MIKIEKRRKGVGCGDEKRPRMKVHAWQTFSVVGACVCALLVGRGGGKDWQEIRLKNWAGVHSPVPGDYY